MAKKIAVEHSQDRLKKTVAVLLVRRLVAEWVIPGVMIRRLSTKTAPLDIRSCRIQAPNKIYIPAKLPPAEVSGCHFQPPTPTSPILLPSEIPVYRVHE